jgi:hypothetical protein
MRIGGWTRLWIIVVSIYALITMFIAYETSPNSAALKSQWVNEAAVVLSKAISAEEWRVNVLKQYEKQANVFDKFDLTVKKVKILLPNNKAINDVPIHTSSDVIVQKSLNSGLAKEADFLLVNSEQIKRTLLNKTNETAIIWLEKLSLSPKDNQKIFAPVIAELNTKYYEKIKEQEANKNRYLFKLLLWWLIPSLLIYILGKSIKWIIAGFKPNSTTSN